MTESRYKADVGAVIRGLLNGLKHTPATISPLIGIPQATLEGIIAGTEPLTAPVEMALAAVTGINRRDFYPLEAQGDFPVLDDTDAGARIFRADATVRSRRELARGPGVPFYLYADTAMSDASTFRPEWIQELYVHSGDPADALPDWAFNKGHFEHQVTYFIGPVNFHWMGKDGTRHVARMDTGDTNYIVPFTPHTFTTRKEGEGLILAVTYGGAIADPAFRARVSALPMEEFLAEARARAAEHPLPADPRGTGGASILRHADAARGQEEALGVRSLIHSPYQPETRVHEVRLGASNQASISASGDRWAYHLGGGAAVLAWGADRTARLLPGDSLFLKPGTPHRFSAEDPVVEARLLVVDIRPQAGDPWTELALIERFAGEAGLRRVHTETTRWY